MRYQGLEERRREEEEERKTRKNGKETFYENCEMEGGRLGCLSIKLRASSRWCNYLLSIVCLHGTAFCGRYILDDGIGQLKA